MIRRFFRDLYFRTFYGKTLVQMEAIFRRQKEYLNQFRSDSDDNIDPAEGYHTKEYIDSFKDHY